MSKKNPNLLKLKEALGVSYHKAYGIEKNGKSFKFFITKCIVFQCVIMKLFINDSLSVRYAFLEFTSINLYP